MIKLGQVLYKCSLEEREDKNGKYSPRLVKSVWVVCKIGNEKHGCMQVSLSNGVGIKKEKYFPNPRFSTLKPQEVLNNYFKTELASVRQLVEKKNPYATDDYPKDWADEWVKDQAMIARAIKKLRGVK